MRVTYHLPGLNCGFKASLGKLEQTRATENDSLVRKTNARQGKREDEAVPGRGDDLESKTVRSVD